MTLSGFRGTGLFVFSDPGGAKPVLALVGLLQAQLSAYKVISDRQYSFFDNFSVHVSKPQLSATEELRKSRPDFLFTGTSYTSPIELEYIKAAKELLIPSYAFVDHWTSIRERFSRNDREVLPDKLLVIDERAKKIALQQGIKKDRIVIFGNPYHQYLKKWKPAVSKKEFIKKLGLRDPAKKIAVYAPDPLSNVDGFSAFGFDEIIATDIFVKAVKELQDQYSFVCNPHPNQKLNLLLPVSGADMIIVPQGTDVNTLIFYADVIIGFFSNILIEAGVMKKPVIRFFIRPGLKDPFEGMGVGKIAYPNTIVQEIKMVQ